MKTILDPEQVKEMTSKGISFPYSLPIHDGTSITNCFGENEPAPQGWYLRVELDDLLAMIPKFIEDEYSTYNFRMEFNSATKKWSVGHFIWGMSYFSNYICEEDELIDSLSRYIIKLFESGEITK